jgi:alpha-galactosidase
MMTKKIPQRTAKLLLLGLLAALQINAAGLPVDLPVPDPGDVGAIDKPVKVYIVSGQSNSLGFGKVEGASPFYSYVFLSADPSAEASEVYFNKSNAALLPLGVFQSATADAKTGAVVTGANVATVALGTTQAKIPEATGSGPVVVKTFIEVPFNGVYRIHQAGGAARVKVDSAAPDAESGGVTLKKNQRHALEITYPKGGVSAALWLEKIDLEGMGDLRWVVEKLGRFPYMLDEQGEWTERQDVMLNDAYMGKGKSAPLSAPATGRAFGPELGFGYVMGAFHDEPVIVMKADIGNRSLGWDILPPGTESWTHEGKAYPGYGMRLNDKGVPVKAKAGEWYAGKQYDEYTAALRNVLDNFDEKYPQYADQGFEVAGFVWWQGHKDGPNPGHNAYYEKNLINLIHAWRKEFDAPGAKWAIATVGFNGEEMRDHYVQIAEAQLAVADPQRHPELAGTVKTIDTRPFWRSATVSPKNQYYHYHHNAETYMLTGDALGRAMVELNGGEVAYPSSEMDPSISAVPDLPRAKDPQILAIRNALRPIIEDKLIPDFVASAPNIPAYRRGGLPIENIIAGRMPEKPTARLTSQYDRLLNLYAMGGNDAYDWKPTGPDMQLAEWHYLTFDPVEKKTSPKGDRYREVTLPEGSENWTSPAFDPAHAGWKTGLAPFGQKNGKQVALRSGCTIAHCGCHITPNTLWDKEVLLIRQSFKLPAFEDGMRYRLIVGGTGHAWSGEGFALYMNGKQVTEMTGGYYKSGGDARGVYLFEDLAAAASGQEVTLAVKAFLRQNGHRNKPASPSGHLSVWLEAAALPALLDSFLADSN